MQLKAKAFSAAQIVRHESDVASVSFDGQELVVIVGCYKKPNGMVAAIKVRFREASALRYLDEADLARYWISDNFPRGHHVLEVVEGGWGWEESELQGYATSRREWLIVTGNGCLNVFSHLEPEIIDTEYTVEW